jgi:3-oxoacyl-[acyl-carrier protein] reductase
MVRYDFSGKVVLVTGSSRGMGAAILEGFARAGAVCLLNYYPDPAGENQRDAETLAQKLRGAGATVHLLGADVSQYDAVEQMIRQAVTAAGKIDILVNNAGILRDKTMKKMTLDDWRTVMQTNLDGVFICSKLAAEVLADGGRMNDAAAKAGVIALTRVLAKELARRQITVNAVAPGIIETPMLGALKPEVRESYEKQIPVGRVGQPADVAHAVLFLACEESGYITGQTLPITGGWF